jgi:hypothetical protein
MKPFTTIAGLLFLAAAAVHAYRLYVDGFAVTVAGHAIPLWASWLGIGLGLLFGIMLLVEARR